MKMKGKVDVTYHMFDTVEMGRSEEYRGPADLRYPESKIMAENVNLQRLVVCHVAYQTVIILFENRSSETIFDMTLYAYTFIHLFRKSPISLIAASVCSAFVKVS